MNYIYSDARCSSSSSVIYFEIPIRPLFISICMSLRRPRSSAPEPRAQYRVRNLRSITRWTRTSARWTRIQRRALRTPKAMKSPAIQARGRPDLRGPQCLLTLSGPRGPRRPIHPTRQIIRLGSPRGHLISRTRAISAGSDDWEHEENLVACYRHSNLLSVLVWSFRSLTSLNVENPH